ncbi:MAG TPA: cytochrome P450, partial [Burkholderiaceae bacterium]|nr:cytochrome P450 [Burkholderiaceae bacterium]
MRQIAELPGPGGLPLIGNLLQVRRNEIHRDVERWAREHGPLFRFSFGRSAILGVADHELLNTLLRDRPDGFRRTRYLELISREMGLTPGLFGSNGDAWRRQRRMVMAGLDPNHVREYFPSLLRVTQRLRGRWQQAARGGHAIDLQPDLMRFTVDAIAGLAFGADINTLESDADIIQRHLDKIFPALFKRMFSLLPVWRWRRSKADRELAQSVAAVNSAIAEFIVQARARLAADAQRRSAPPNLLESMIVAADSPDSGITDTEVAGNVLTMLLAGEDTTANTLAWMIYLLHRHPDALQRARAEVLAAAGGIDQLSPERMASLDYLVAARTKQRHNRADDVRLVVNDENAGSHRYCTTGTGRTAPGTAIENRAPAPGIFSAQTRPPSAASRPRVIDNPMPVPN